MPRYLSALQTAVAQWEEEQRTKQGFTEKNLQDSSLPHADCAAHTC